MSEADKASRAAEFGINFSEYKKRIIGKEKECEFLLIMKALHVLKHFVAFDEGLSHVTHEFTSDYLITMPDGYKMMIEVKHVDKNKYSISGSNLQKRIDFAKQFDVPLRFAISLRGFWGFFTSDYLQSKSGKIELSEDYLKNSYLDLEFGTCSYMFTNEIKSESVFSQRPVNGLGINSPPYGELTSYRLFSDNKLVFEVTSKKDTFYSHLFLIGALQDRMANDYINITESNDGCTLITEKLTQSHFIPEFEFILSTIRHLSPLKGTNPEDNIFTLASPDSKKYELPHIGHYRLLMSDLADKNVAFTCFRGREGYSFKDFAKMYWTKHVPEL